MACKDINNMMTAFLDNELTHEEQELIKAHLSTCLKCKRELEALALMQADLIYTFRSEASQYSPSPLVWQRIKQQTTTKNLAARAMGRLDSIRLFRRKLGWKTGLVAASFLIIVVGLAIVLPSLINQDDTALAAKIALNSSEVQAALGGKEPSAMAVTSIANDEDKKRVVMRVEPGIWVVADVDMSNQEVISVEVQELSDITEQDVIDLATTDSRVQELFDKGYHIVDLEFVEIYPAIVDVWIDDYGYLPEINPEDLIGLTVKFLLQPGDGSSPLDPTYAAIANVTTGKFVTLLEPGQGPDVTITHTVDVPS